MPESIFSDENKQFINPDWQVEVNNLLSILTNKRLKIEVVNELLVKTSMKKDEE